jgi:hypothetical protein
LETALVLPVHSWASWTRGRDEAPRLAFIEPMIRRRLSFVDRIALHVAQACVPDGEPARMVFASRHGELARGVEMLQGLASGEPVSPMNFSLSVLNAAPGLFGIARKDLSASTAIAGGEASFMLGLVEAAAQAQNDPQTPVLLAFADDAPPEAIRELVDSPREPYAIALRLDARAPRRRLRLDWVPAAGGPAGADDAAQAVAGVLGCLNDGTAASWAGPDQTWRWSLAA